MDPEALSPRRPRNTSATRSCRDIIVMLCSYGLFEISKIYHCLQ